MYRGPDGFDFSRFFDAVETAPPTAAVRVFAEALRERLGARQVSFLITDFDGQSLVRLGHASTEGPPLADGVEQVSIEENPDYHRALISQEVQAFAEGNWVRMLAPVTARGDAIGLLELVLPASGAGDLVDVVAGAAHVLAYVITTERRHTDLYEWGRRSSPVSLAAEIQRRLLPSSLTCEAGPLTLSAWLEPASNVGGDSFDYALDDHSFYLSITDAMGHQVNAALLATLAVSALRNSRRASEDLSEMARRASAEVRGYRRGSFVTGLLGSVDLSSGRMTLVNAGHPTPILVRNEQVQPLDLRADVPLGVIPDYEYRAQTCDLQVGDRMIFLTDGMLERNARNVDLGELVLQTRDAHPRQALQTLTRAVHDACGGELRDDATALCLDWYGVDGARRSIAGSPRVGS
ncbi:MAG TPA: PP2C family protein-serine/threonine phosphatase [Jatrophihabitans sp.]|nr:PP2C family protein-serine/threonine phosphatase [Jatrophihabitans sp.]